MARRRLALALIEDRRARKAAFARRLRGLKKKARELHTLCGVDVLLIVFSGDGLDGEEVLHTWAPNDDPAEGRRIAERFCRLSEREQSLNAKTLSDVLAAAPENEQQQPSDDHQQPPPETDLPMIPGDDDGGARGGFFDYSSLIEYNYLLNNCAAHPYGMWPDGGYWPNAVGVAPASSTFVQGRCVEEPLEAQQEYWHWPSEQQNPNEPN